MRLIVFLTTLLFSFSFTLAFLYKPSHIRLASNARKFSVTINIADGLDAETLNALGDVEELNQALDVAIDGGNPAVSILTDLVGMSIGPNYIWKVFHLLYNSTLINAASPAILAIPIGAGVLVALVIGFFIGGYSQGKEVDLEGEGRKWKMKV